MVQKTNVPKIDLDLNTDNKKEKPASSDTGFHQGLPELFNRLSSP
jgi:hypothetical protein